MEINSTVQDYLKNTYRLQLRHNYVPTRVLVERLALSAPAVTGMTRKLTRMGLLVRERYKGVRLTPEGERIALRVIRAHRLWELYLVQVLGLSWDQAHVEAEQLEHVLSDRLADRLDQVLDYPTFDPDGHPIPSPQGEVIAVGGVSLAELSAGETGVAVQIRDDTPELLRYLARLDIYPGRSITVLQVDPFDGPIHVQVRDGVQVLGRRVAEHVVVRPQASEGAARPFGSD